MLLANDLPSATVGSMQSQITIHWRALKTQQRVQYEIFQELFAWLKNQIYQTLQQIVFFEFQKPKWKFHLKAVIETSSTGFA